MKTKDSSSNNGIGVLGALGVLFVALKLTGYITWSWWLVTAPFWGGILLAIAGTLVLAIYLHTQRNKLKFKRKK